MLTLSKVVYSAIVIALNEMGINEMANSPPTRKTFGAIRHP